MCCTIRGFLGSGESIRRQRRDVFKATRTGLCDDAANREARSPSRFSAFCAIYGPMNALANRRFLKMNGLGNEITVLDLRGTPHRGRCGGRPRHRGRSPHSRFDQLMVLHDPRQPRHRRLSAHLQHGRLGIGRLRQRHPLRRLGDDGRSGHGRPVAAATSFSRPRPGCCRPACLGHGLHRRHGRAASSPGTRSRCRALSGHTRDRARRPGCPRRRSCRHPSAVSMGNPHAIFFGRRSGRLRSCAGSARCSSTIRSSRSGPTSASPGSPAPSIIVLRVWERGAGADPRLRLRRLRGGGGSGPQGPDRAQGHRLPARRRPRHRMARRATTTC